VKPCRDSSSARTFTSATVTVPSFTQHIRPLIERTADLRWVHGWDEWNALQPLDWAALSDPGPASGTARETMADEIRTPDLILFGLPHFMATYLEQWEAGNFVNDVAESAPETSWPEQLARVSLDGCSGINFFPRIEGGQSLKDKDIYARPIRLDLTNAARVYPGCLTEILAVPWQADFLACDGGAWWPTQRPDMVMLDPQAVPASVQEWEDPIRAFSEMVEHVLRVGFVVAQLVDGQTVFVEVDQGPGFTWRSPAAADRPRSSPAHGAAARTSVRRRLPPSCGPWSAWVPGTTFSPAATPRHPAPWCAGARTGPTSTSSSSTRTVTAGTSTVPASTPWCSSAPGPPERASRTCPGGAASTTTAPDGAPRSTARVSVTCGESTTGRRTAGRTGPSGGVARRTAPRRREEHIMEERFFARGSIPRVLPWEREDTARLAVAEAARALGGSLHDPPLEPRDEAVFLLTAAAEVEHALMTQYLYAAYSVRIVEGDPHETELVAVRNLLTQIAREEMGHLATVQNLLHVVGGPLNLGREHSPFASGVSPFRYTLEPLSLGSLAKYVMAESPDVVPEDLPEDDRTLLEQISAAAVAANDGQPIRHVGVIFERLVDLFTDPVQGLADADLRVDTYGQQAKFADWGYEPRTADDGETLIVDSFEGTDPAAVRAAALDAVRRVGEQGEGFDVPPAGPGSTESHFERFLDLHKRVSALLSAGATIAWPVATNPNTTSSPAEAPGTGDPVVEALEARAVTGRIAEPHARAWAHLFNLRYRLLLQQFSHFLRLDHELYAGGQGPDAGDRTDRGLLLIWTFDEMRRLQKIAGKLVQLPKDAGGTVNAGPPFELPYTLHLPDGEAQRWRAHLDASRAADRLIRTQLQPDDMADGRDGFLDDVLSADAVAQSQMQSLAEGGGVPPESLPTDFRKVAAILEEAVRGFTVGPPHRSFWADRNREDFLKAPVGAVARPPGPDTDPVTVVPDPDAAPLVGRLEGTAPGNRMPRFRPPVPAERIAYIRRWIAAGAPDNVPADQIGVRHEREPLTGEVPPPDPLSFESDIKPLFREDPDRSSMLSFGLDLHEYEDVRDRAADIAERLEDGTMPCDGAWPQERIDRFNQWVAQGAQP
jgi:hypothetical protein